MHKMFTGLCTALFFTLLITGTALAETYYISPSGNDSKTGKSESEAFATFTQSWKVLYAGDTLILLDGVYKQTLQPMVRGGLPGNPITIKAKNDGRAIIDGEFVRDVVRIGDWTPREWFVIEGIVGMNALNHVFFLDKASNNVLRRVSGYNANPDDNSSVFGLIHPESQHNLLEDCVAAGTGRKMIYTYGGSHNTFRRCFTAWTRWDGRKFCGQQWPNGANLQFYGGSYNRMENSISFGGVPKWAVSMGNQGNLGDPTMRGNEILGTISLYAGLDWTGKPINYGTRPACLNPNETPVFANLQEWPYFRIGFLADKQDNTTVENNVFRDIFAYGNYSEGMGYYASTFTSPGKGFLLDHATLVGNLGQARIEGPNPNLGQYSTARFDATTNSFIGGSIYQDEGARLSNRYVDGVLTNQALWPWPMEDRIKAELGLSVNGIVKPLIDSKGTTLPTLPSTMPASLPINLGTAPLPTPTNTPNGPAPTSTKTPIPATPISTPIATATRVPPTATGVVATATGVVATATNSPTPTPTAVVGVPTATNTPISGKARITLVQDSQPNSVQDFTFYGAFGSFKLDDASPNDGDAFNSSIPYNSVSPGIYNFSQARQTSWKVSAINCTPATKATVNLANRSVSIQAAAGDVITCTFISQRLVTMQATAFNDLNRDGLHTSDEPLLAGGEFAFYNGDTTAISQSVSNATGSVMLTNQAVSTYKVCASAQTNWITTQPVQLDPVLNQPCHNLTLDAGQGAKLFFGTVEGMSEPPQTLATNAGVQIYELEDINEAPEEESQTEVQQQVFLPLVSR